MMPERIRGVYNVWGLGKNFSVKLVLNKILIKLLQKSYLLLKRVSFLISWISQKVLIWIGKFDTSNDLVPIFGDISSQDSLRLIGKHRGGFIFLLQ